jgi:hypothetical protein
MSGGNRGCLAISSTSTRPAPIIRFRPTKNLLAAMAQEVASERYVAFALGKKQAFDTFKVHTSNARTRGCPQSRGTRQCGVGDPGRPLRPSTDTGLGLSRFDLAYATGRLPHEQKPATIELYGCEVIPRVRGLLADPVAEPTLRSRERSAGPVTLDSDAAHMAAVTSIVEERVVLDAAVVPHRHRPRCPSEAARERLSHRMVE